MDHMRISGIEPSLVIPVTAEYYKYKNEKIMTKQTEAKRDSIIDP